MADPNLVIRPSAGLPSLEDVMGELENQPTPDITSELMQVVRTIEKVATTAKNLNGIYVRRLRSAALKVHAGLNVLAHRAEVERRGDGEEVSNLRRKVNGLRLDKERTEREIEEATRSRREAERERERLQRENGDLRGRVKGLEEELLEMKERLIEGLDGGDRRTERGGRTPSPARPSPPRIHLSPDAGVGGVRASPAESGGRHAPPSPVGGAGIGPGLLQQMEEVIGRIVEQMVERLGGVAPRTVTTDPPADFDRLPAPEAPIPGTSDAGGGPEPGKKKKKKKKKKGSTAPALEYFGREEETEQPPETTTREAEPASTWATVVKRGRGPGQGAPPRPTQLPRERGQGTGRGGGGGAFPPVRGGRAPTTAAVTITAPDGSYAEVMRKARQSIGAEKLRSLGIEDMRARRGMTGSYVLEIPGPAKEDRESKAEALAAEMRRVFAEDSTVQIGRPAAAICIRGLDEAVTVGEVVEAIVARGVAGPDEVRATISRPAYGMGVAWVRCPVRAADDLAKAGRIKIGWASARVELAVARPSHCFKCWREGHVAARCGSQEDRSRACYRCGAVGHIASVCQSTPRCLACAEAGRSAEHRMGGVGCGSVAGRGSRTPAPPQTGRGPRPQSQPRPRQQERRQPERRQQEQDQRQQEPPADPPPLEKRPTRERASRKEVAEGERMDLDG